MGRHHHGRPHPVVQGFEQAQQFQRHFGIDIAGRLIRDQHPRARNHRAGNGNALLLPARQCCRDRMGAVGKADPVEHFRNRFHHPLFIRARQAQRQRDIVERGEMRHQPEILEHHPQPTPQIGQAIARHGDQILPEHPDSPARGALRQVQQFEQAGLARPARTGQEIETAGIKCEGQIAQHFGIGAVTQADIIELHDLGRAIIHRAHLSARQGRGKSNFASL